MGARLDQHFLVDERARDAIVSAADVRPGETVVEIGPGRGILTGALLARGAQVVAVEMDNRLAEKLPALFPGHAALRVVNADFLKLDLAELGDGPVKFVANLPYSVATPILQRILYWPRWTQAVLMFQKEVAERITAEPGGGDYGLLTLSVQARARAEMILELGRESFAPRPKVASAVVRLTRHTAALIETEAREKMFFRVAKAAFGQRRKMASGLIARALNMERKDVVEALERRGLKPGCRAEEIPFDAYLSLVQELCP